MTGKSFRILILLSIISVCLSITLFNSLTTKADSAKEIPSSIELGMYYDVLRDSSNTLTIDDMLSRKYESSFSRSTEKYLSFFHTDDTIWLRLNADEIIQDKDDLYWLEYNDKIEFLSMYLVKNDGSYDVQENGLFNLSAQPIQFPSLLFTINDPDVKEIYLKLDGKLPITVFTTLYSSTEFSEHSTSYKFYTGIFYGFLLALALYNLFLYFSFKERSYLYYTLYMLSFMLFQATMNLFDVELLGNILPPWLLTKTLAISCNLMIVFMILFGKEFLELKQRLPKSNAILTIALSTAGLSTLALFIGVEQQYTDLFITSSSLLVLLFLWISGFRLLLKGFKPARFYIIGWSVLLGSMSIQALIMLDVVPMSLIIFEEIPSYSVMFEALILSLALADKINLIIKENQKTQDELNETLELKVIERTKQLEDAQVELKHLANTDRLTQIANRVRLDHILDTEFERAVHDGGSFSVILIDLDYFKHVNDTFGHQTGDYVLREAANVFKGVARGTDTLGRWGGEEFLLVAPLTTLEEALQLAEKLRAQLAGHHFIDVGKETASFGVASYIPGDTLTTIILRSDNALYKAKENGRNRVEYMEV